MATEKDLKSTSGRTSIPVMEEELRVEKRTVAKGTTKVTVRVTEVEEAVALPLVNEVAEVRHVPINRFIDRPARTRTEGDVTIVPVVEEVLVVEKRLRLKEEIHITRRKETEMQTHKEILRKEEATVEHKEHKDES